MKISYKGNALNGILRYLFDKNREEYLTIVKTYASSVHDSNYLPINVINFADDDKLWHAKDFENIGNYIVVYLPNYCIKLEGYSIQTSNIGPSSTTCHPKNWGFDASNDNRTWNHQVNITDDGTMNEALATRYIKWSHGTYKYFRLMITGQQHDTKMKNSLDLNQIEFFGTLIPQAPCFCSCKYIKHSAFSLLCLLLIF